MLVWYLFLLADSFFFSVVFYDCVFMFDVMTKDWSFSFSLSPSNEYSGLISFRMDWLDLAVQGTRMSLLQHPSSKASILGLSAFFMVQLSHPHTTTGKTMALTNGPLPAKWRLCFLMLFLVPWFRTSSWKLRCTRVMLESMRILNHWNIMWKGAAWELHRRMAEGA